ncbi:hypothetical protein nACB1_039 [Acinetobacter phage nACB1]|nr:hypothetical protein nACB1_039 [Acinetobacter phage nACB1]
MPSGLEAYSDSGILQFDSNYPQYSVSKVITKPVNSNNPVTYTAGPSHLLVGVNLSTAVNAAKGLCTINTGTVYEGNNTFRVSMQLDVYTFENIAKFIVFEPFNLLNAQSPGSGVGLEVFDENSKLTYTTQVPNLRVVATHVLPDQVKAQGMLYGTGAGVINANNYKWTTNIFPDDISNYGIAFAQPRLGNRVEYDGSEEVITLHDSAKFSINSSGYLEVLFSAAEGSATSYGAPYNATNIWVSHGVQIAYVIDVRAIRHLL